MNASLLLRERAIAECKKAGLPTKRCSVPSPKSCIHLTFWQPQRLGKPSIFSIFSGHVAVSRSRGLMNLCGIGKLTCRMVVSRRVNLQSCNARPAVKIPKGQQLMSPKQFMRNHQGVGFAFPIFLFFSRKAMHPLLLACHLESRKSSRTRLGDVVGFSP